MIDDIINDLKDGFDKAYTKLTRELGRIRTGRASANMLDEIRVDYYGSPTPLSQVATIKVPEPRMITISPWDRSVMKDIEKAILASDLGLNPNNDGTLIRLVVPPLTGERRTELVKTAKKVAEDARVAVRGARRDANEMLKSLEKDGDISEDDLHRSLTRVQELTDKAIEHVDGLVARKEAEILEV
ncbi:MAG: ribosome recycling factor [Myxococcales bacterium]|jgi:ribosome recycling factor|nr:ribosome recycling factor [Myxococcales bacterium]